MMKFWLLTLLFFGFLHFCNGQQLPHYNQYRQFQAYLNPASVSSDYFLYDFNLNINAGYRAQWIEQPETPRLAQFSAEFIPAMNTSFDLLSGVTVIQEALGPLGLTGFHGRIGSLFSADPYWGAFSVGLSFGLVEYRLNAEDIVWKDGEDPLIPLFNVAEISPDLGLGIYYYKRLGAGYFDQDNIYFGLSIPQLFSANLTIPTEDSRVTPFKRVPHLFASAGWYHFFNEDTYLESSIWFRYAEGLPINLDINGRLQIGPTIWFGGGYNLNGIAHLEGGIIVPGIINQKGGLKLGYGFDYSISAFNLNLGTSHEIIIAFNFDTLR